MARLKLSIVYYLNALPLSWGFLHGEEKDRFELDFSPPSRCADLLAEGGVDIGLIPAIEYQRIQGLQIVPGLSVAAKGQVQSVLLLSKLPAAQIRSVAADSSSRTSTCLLEILLRERYQSNAAIHVEKPNLEAMLQRHDAALLIGDAALKVDASGLFCYDLAEEWRDLTGKPFVFAFWSAREHVVLREKGIFGSSYRYGAERIEEIVSEQSRELGLGAMLIRDYLTKKIDYSLDSENLEGLRLFYDMAKGLRLLRSLRGLQFLE